MTHVYYKNSDFCLVMFDLMNRDSFLACAKWKLDLDEKYRMKDGSPCPCLLIGNKVNNNFFFSFIDHKLMCLILRISILKCDLSNRLLEQPEIEDFCRQFGFCGYMEISVKKDIMVKETIKY
jgi:hypothetical protein